MLELGARPTDTLAEPPSVELRPLQPDDWGAVAEIYWDGMRDGLATFQTEVPSWAEWDAAHLRGHRLVADLLGEVVGWAALSPASTRRCYAGVVENSIYVAQGARGLGIGRALLEALIAGAERRGDLDDPDLDLPGEPRLAGTARALRVPRRRNTRARCKTRWDLAGHRVPRATK